MKVYAIQTWLGLHWFSKFLSSSGGWLNRTLNQGHYPGHFSQTCPISAVLKPPLYFVFFQFCKRSCLILNWGSIMRFLSLTLLPQSQFLYGITYFNPDWEGVPLFCSKLILPFLLLNMGYFTSPGVSFIDYNVSLRSYVIFSSKKNFSLHLAYIWPFVKPPFFQPTSLSIYCLFFSPKNSLKGIS